MKNAFKGGGLGNVFAAVVDIISVSILWCLCCLPVITIGPACAALYHSMVKSVLHGRGHAISTFFSALKSNFKGGIKAWLLFLLLIVLWLINNIITAQTDPEGARLMTRLSVFLIIPVCFPLPWLFSYISRFDNSTGDSLKYAVYLSARYFVRTLIIFAIIAAFAFICRLSPVLTPILPGFCCLALSSQIEPIFKSITSRFENDSNDDQWYNE